MNKLSLLFNDYVKEAFRLEILPFYKVEGEWENFQNYLNTGTAVPDQNLIDYLNGVEQKTNQGADHIRVRVIENPINDYQIFETKIGYIPSSKLGTKMYFIDRDRYNDLTNAKAEFKKVRDFWLFDQCSVAFLNYSNAGEWKGFEIGDENDVEVCLELRSLLIENSFSLNSLIERLT
jgi:hypothetical protein